jgi:hypothetical protein
MPNFRTHIISGIIGFPIFFFVFNIISYLFTKNFYSFSASEITISYALFILGSDFPDVDHQKSLINRFFRILLILVSVYYFFEYDYIFKHYIPFKGPFYYLLIIFVGISVGTLFGIIFNNTTKHRGAWHSILTAVLLSVILFLLNTKYYILIKFFYSFSLFIGHITHLSLDTINTNLKKKKRIKIKNKK